jgi:hypothetical protein
MLERLRQLIARLRFDPRKAGLGWSLAAINFAIVVLVVTGISISAVGMLRDLADEQGKARVQLAGAIAREDLRRMGEDALSAARILAERPALARLLSERRFDAVSPLLKRFCETDTIDACAVFEGNTLLAQAGATIPWPLVVTASAEQGERFLAVPESTTFALQGAVTSVANRPNMRVFIVRLLDADLAAEMSKHVGLEVRLINYRGYTSAPVDDFTPLHSAGLADGRWPFSDQSPISTLPVFRVASTGEAIVLIETSLRAADIDTPGPPHPAAGRHGHRAIASCGACRRHSGAARPRRSKRSRVGLRLGQAISPSIPPRYGEALRAPWKTCAAIWSTSRARCAGRKPKRARCSPASSRACTRSTRTAPFVISIRRPRSCSTCARKTLSAASAATFSNPAT